MAINFPGPFEVRIRVTTNEPASINVHQMRASCEMAIAANPGDPFSAWFPEQKGGGSAIALSTHVENLLAKAVPYFNTAVTFGPAELWEYAPGTFDAVFRAAYNPSAEPSGVPATVVASQSIFTLRTALGGIFKHTWMGVHIAPGLTIPYGASGAGIDLVFDYFLGATSPWIGRDGSYPVAALAFHPGQNEALWKVVNRS